MTERPSESFGNGYPIDDHIHTTILLFVFQCFAYNTINVV